MSEGDERYFRNVYDHLIRISDLIDTYRGLLTGAMDVYLSTVSNRLNVVMKQLAVIANHLSAAQLAHGLLRPELRLSGQPHRPVGKLRRPGHLHRGGRGAGSPGHVPAPRVIL